MVVPQKLPRISIQILENLISENGIPIQMAKVQYGVDAPPCPLGKLAFFVEGTGLIGVILRKFGVCMC